MSTDIYESLNRMLESHMSRIRFKNRTDDEVFEQKVAIETITHKNKKHKCTIK